MLCSVFGLVNVLGPLQLDEHDEPRIDGVRTAQRLAGGLNWLATRARPDIAFYVSQLASAATRCPDRAIRLGKQCLRYLAGTSDHGIHLKFETHHLRGVGVFRASMGYGDASYEAGWAQTGAVTKYRGMFVSWKSTRQVQVPRSTAEAEITAMAYASHHLEGINALYDSMHVRVGGGGGARDRGPPPPRALGRGGGGGGGRRGGRETRRGGRGGGGQGREQGLGHRIRPGRRCRAQAAPSWRGLASVRARTELGKTWPSKWQGAGRARRRTASRDHQRRRSSSSS